MADNNVYSPIPARLHSVATEGVVSGADEIFDDAKGKRQSVINQETDAALDNKYDKDETYSKQELNNLITTPNQDYVTVPTYGSLPATGEADTVYRVSNYDGTQEADGVYSEYAWSGSAYVFLAAKSSVGEVFDISEYHAGAKYADLAAALDSDNGGGVPQSLQKGGMSIKFVSNSDNKYVQFRYMSSSTAVADFTNVVNWQGVVSEPVAGSSDFVESDSLSVYDLWISGKNIFAASGKYRSVNGSVVIESGYETTPIIPLSYFRGCRENGITIKSGTFRCNSSNKPVILFYDSARVLLSYIIDTTTYSSVTGIESSSIPVDAAYIAFNCTTNGDVVFNNFGASEQNKTEIDALKVLGASLERDVESGKFVYLYDTNIFTIAGYYRNNSNQLVSGGGNYKTTPLIPIALIKDCRTKGINIVSGTFRAAPNETRSLAVYLDESYTVVGVDDSSNTISSVTPIPASSIPSTAKYVAFNSYKGNNDVILKDFGLKGLSDSIAKNAEDIAGLEDEIDTLYIPTAENLCTGNFTDTFVRYGSGSTHQLSDSELSFSYIGTRASAYSTLTNVFEEEHVVYVGEWMKSTVNDQFLLSSNSLELYVANRGNNEYQWMSGCMKITKDGNNNTILGINYLRSEDASFGERNVDLKYPVIIDLTAAFGAGNEPSSVEVDDMLTKFIDRWFVGTQPIMDFNSKEVAKLLRSRNEINTILGNDKNVVAEVVNVTMGRDQFISAYNSALSTFSNLCGCRKNCMSNLYFDLSDEENISRINHNFRDDVISKDMTYETICNRINNAFQKKIYRFADAKLNDGTPRAFSINPNIQAEEPSFIVSPDCETLYLYSNNKRWSSTDGVNWDSGTSLVQANYPEGLALHSVFNVIDGVYYHIFTNKISSTYYDLHLATSNDGVNFTYRGIIFKKGHVIDENRTVDGFGNSFLLKEPGGNKYYLYYESQAENTGTYYPWEINLATCTDLFIANEDGTIGNWEDADNNPILTYLPYEARRTGTACCNPDIARGIDNRPIRVDGKFFMYYHGTHESTGHLYRAYSYDLVNWIKEGEILDNRDVPSVGDTQSANTDHSIIQFKNRTYMVYNKDINLGSAHPAHFYLMIDDRPYEELLKLKP